MNPETVTEETIPPRFEMNFPVSVSTVDTAPNGSELPSLQRCDMISRECFQR